MPCCGGLLIYPGQYKSPTGMEMDGCPIRLKEINQQRNPAPTRLVGAEVARGNLIRRRVGTMKATSECFGYKGEQCNPDLAYGPVFGLRQAPRFGSRCGDRGFRNIYSANHGDSSDVTMWKRLYGGPRQLFSTKACAFGCCGNITANRDVLNINDSRGVYFGGARVGPQHLGNCLRYSVTGDVRAGDVVWKDDNTTPNFYQAVSRVSGRVWVIRSSSMRKYFAGPGRTLNVYRRNLLNQWLKVGTAQTGSLV